MTTERIIVLILRNNPILHHIIRMRNIHQHIKAEYGLKNVRLFHRWEKLECKMVDFKNHRRFSLRCLSADIIPVSIRLKSNIKSPKGFNIIKKAEKALLNEGIRMVNNTITMLEKEIDTCMIELYNTIDEELMEECMVFIKTRKESRHIKTQLRQINKFNQLCQKDRGGHPNQQYGSIGRHASKLQLTAGETVEKTRETLSTAEDASNTTTTTKSRAKWVINISSKPLSTVQERLLAWGPNFAIVPREPPIVNCITEVEKVCQKLEHGVADELRGRIKTILKKAKTPRQNITKEEHKAIGELKRDNNRLVLTADKGVALVVMDKEDYVQKARELLDQPTYRTINNDPTTKYKNKLVNLLKSIKSEGEMDEALYKKLYPTGAGSPKFYGLPKIHMEGNPLRPIVSSIGAASYEVAKELAKILKPLVGKSMYHIHNTQDFIQQIKDIKLQKDQCMVSFDVKALFTSVPIKPAINTIKKLLEGDPELQKEQPCL